MDQIKIIAIVLSAILGLCVGSFLNVVIYRLPNGMNLAKPASHCPKCNNLIKWYDNIPVLSYLILGGKCRHCKEHISIRYTIVELLNALLWVGTVLMFWSRNIPYTITMCITCSVLICIFFIDLEHMIIPDSLQLCLLACAITMIFTEWDPDNTWKIKLYGLLVLGGLSVILHYGSMIVFKKEALGGGDVKLLAICGLLLGLTNSILALVLACVVASIVLLVIKAIKKYKSDKEYPFAPFIVFGVIIALFFGYYLIQGYLEIIR